MENGPLWRSIRAPHFSGRNDFTTGYRRPKPVKRVCRLSPSKQDQLKSMFSFYECCLRDQFRFKMYGWSLWNGNETNQTLVTWWCGFHKLITSLITSNDDINHVQVLYNGMRHAEKHAVNEVTVLVWTCKDLIRLVEIQFDGWRGTDRSAW